MSYIPSIIVRKICPCQFGASITTLNPCRYLSYTSNVLTDPTLQWHADQVHCRDLVRTRDHEGYLCGLLMPTNTQDSYFAIRALYVDLALMKDGGVNATERPQQVGGCGTRHEGSSLAGHLRMKWWKDAVTGIYNTHSKREEPCFHDFISGAYEASQLQSPIVRSMQLTVSNCQLTKQWFDDMIQAREHDLENDYVVGLEEILRYADDTVGSFLRLSLECCGVTTNTYIEEMVRHLGWGIGVVTAIRSVSYRALLMGDIAIPLDVMKKHHVPEEYLRHPLALRIHEGKQEPVNDEEKMARKALKSAIEDMAQVARYHLSHARGLQTRIPKEGRACFLPAVFAIQYLDRLERVDFDVFHEDLISGRDTLVFRYQRLVGSLLLGRAWLTGIF